MNREENREFSTAPMESGSFTVSPAASIPGAGMVYANASIPGTCNMRIGTASMR